MLYDGILILMKNDQFLILQLFYLNAFINYIKLLIFVFFCIILRKDNIFFSKG